STWSWSPILFVTASAVVAMRLHHLPGGLSLGNGLLDKGLNIIRCCGGGRRERAECLLLGRLSVGEDLAAKRLCVAHEGGAAHFADGPHLCEGGADEGLIVVG